MTELRPSVMQRPLSSILAPSERDTPTACKVIATLGPEARGGWACRLPPPRAHADAPAPPPPQSRSVAVLEELLLAGMTVRRRARAGPGRNGCSCCGG